MIITDLAKNKVQELIKVPKEVMPNHDFFLRITAVKDDTVKYQTYFDYEIRDNDTVFHFDGFDLRIDKDSLEHLDLATLDLIEDGFILTTKD